MSFRKTFNPCHEATLKTLCLKEIIKKPSTLCQYSLPLELGDLIAIKFREYAIVNRLEQFECEHFFNKFKHKYIPLSRIDFSDLPISPDFLLDFLSKYKELNEINISKCLNINRIDIHRFNAYLLSKKKEPISLIIGSTFNTVIDSRRGEPYAKLFDDNLQIKKLVLYAYSRSDSDEYIINQQLSQFITPSMIHSLKYLDLSTCSIGHGTALAQLESLEVLILYNCVMNYPEVVQSIKGLKRIRFLDISRQVLESEDSSTVFENPALLDVIVSQLPNLTHLDISGTNLVGSKDRCISAFESRSDRPFEFLGLFHTGIDAAYRSCIPATIVAGEATEIQMLNACKTYMDRPNQLSKALNDLYNYYKTNTPSETFSDVNRALDVILPIMKKCINDEQVIIFATAALWCVVKINVTAKNLNDASVRRTITSQLLDVMYYHITSRVVLINGGLTLLFLPDIIYEHSRIAYISVIMCQDSDQRTQGFGTTLLNTLACQVGGEQKIFIGKLNAIETLLDIIKSKIREEFCDDILETAWSTLWNITDETPINCQRFLDIDGLKAFETCMDKFSDNRDVLKNMMGLLGNVAECRELRVNFMDSRYIERFHDLLKSQIDGIECSYNACGILAHICSDGQEFWDKHFQNPYSSTKREVIMRAMCNAIERWPINSRRNINYRSFEPITRLLDIGIAPASQYWAVFALTNLTRINPYKYFPMLLEHNGLEKLRLLAQPGNTAPYVMKLAQIGVYQFERYDSEFTLAGLEQCDSIELEVVKNFRAESNNLDGTSEMGEPLL